MGPSGPGAALRPVLYVLSPVRPGKGPVPQVGSLFVASKDTLNRSTPRSTLTVLVKVPSRPQFPRTLPVLSLIPVVKKEPRRKRYSSSFCPSPTYFSFLK